MGRVDVDVLLAHLREVEDLARSPATPGHIQRVEKLLLSIARNAPGVVVAHAAMSALSLVTLSEKPQLASGKQQNVADLLSRIRVALEESKQ